MINIKSFRTFQKASITYFYSSLFFPRQVREDVFNFYSFVRTADDFVDNIPQDKNGFINFKNEYLRSIKTGGSNNSTINNFILLSKKKDFDQKWISSFLNSMEMDLKVANYNNMNQLLKYMYGSSDVIGLIMAKILDLPEKSYKYAGLLGRSMQYVNFIRDIDEDVEELNRTYFPKDLLIKYHLNSLKKSYIQNNLSSFKKFIRDQIITYKSWNKEAEKGFRFIPKRYLIPIKTASDMYLWTAEKIFADPSLIYQKKIKPSPIRVVTKIFSNYKSIYGRNI